MLTPEDEIDVLHQDLGVARRAYDNALRAKYDSRATNEPELDRAIRRKRDRVKTLERELGEMLAAQRAADEAYEGDVA